MGRKPQSWLDTRSAGVLAHVSSLPGRYGIGNLGPGARGFVDFLGAAGVRYWQICPVGPTGFGNSPYQTFSGRAGNPYFIDLDELAGAGLLKADELAPLAALPSDKVDYGKLYENTWRVLARAHDRFVDSGRDAVNDLGSLATFRKSEAAWIEPFAAFMALKNHFGGRAWTAWPEHLRLWSPEVARGLQPSVKREADRHVFYQYLFFGQWARLRRYAAAKGIGIIGDVPIFVALDSADTWQNRAVFRLDGQGRPLAVAGVPPDYFSAKGQLWGNPLYDWDYLANTRYGWWIDRLRATFDLFDIIRLDHFRGFETYWEIPAGALDACDGQWKKGPGMHFFDAVRHEFPEAKIIAEDLGYIGPNVVALRDAAGLPGMKILQFAYGHDAGNVNLPHYYVPDTVVYTGTHDNVTARGWLEHLSGPAAAQVDDYFQLGGSKSAWPVIRAALAAVSRLAVVPMQDLLDLPASATLNRPGTSEGNWQWRFTADELARLSREKAAVLRHWIELYDRKGERMLRDFSEAPAVASMHR
jgi:4-alpha-glucanotransferase